MLILAVDATGGAASCALAQEDVLLAESYLNIGYTHSETLLPLIEGMLHTARRTMEQVDRLAVTVGPGSFTGIRIGLATVKGLAFARGIPCVPVSALEAMAVLCPPGEGVLCPAMDARRSQVYNALFAWQEGALRRLTPDRALSVQELACELEERGLPVWLTGDGALLCAGELRQRGVCVRLAPEHMRCQRALGAALLAREAEPVDAQQIKPVYLRLPQAERERLERGEVAFHPAARDILL